MVQNEYYQRLIDHPRINIDPDELRRIELAFKDYRGEYPRVEEISTNRERIERDFNYLNMTKEVAKHLAALTINEKCEISIGGDATEGKAVNAIQAFWDGIADKTSFLKNLSYYTEVAFATGGLAVKPYFDGKSISFSWCLADAFIPLKMNTSSISEAVIPNTTMQVEGKQTYFYTLLEFHEWNGELYTLSNELYRRKTSLGLGERVPLYMVDDYKHLPTIQQIPRLKRPQFAYFKPAGFNNINPRSPLGLGLCDNARATIDGINMAYDKLWKDINNSEAIKIVSDHFLKQKVDQYGQLVEIFDKTDTVFKALPSGGNMDDMVFENLTSNMRVDAYATAINKYISTLEFQVGLSSNTFVFDGAKGAITATEVVSKDSKTYQTRNKHAKQLESFIIDLVISTFELAKWVKVNGKALYSGDIPSRKEIGVNFDDGVFESRNSELDFYLKAQGFVPKVEVIKALFDIPHSEAELWLKQKNIEV